MKWQLEPGLGNTIGLINSDPIRKLELKNLLTATNGQHDEPFTRNLTGQWVAR